LWLLDIKFINFILPWSGLVYNNAIKTIYILATSVTPQYSDSPIHTNLSKNTIRIVDFYVPSVKGPLLDDTISIIRVAWVWFAVSSLGLV